MKSGVSASKQDQERTGKQIGRPLQISQVILDLFLTQLPKPRSCGTFDTLIAQEMVGRIADDTNLHRVPVHLALDRLFERQERNVNGILTLGSVILPIDGIMLNTSSSSESLYLFSRKVFALVELLPMAVAFQGK